MLKILKPFFKNEIMEIRIAGGTIGTVKNFRNFQSRGDSVLNLMSEMLLKYYDQSLNKKIIIHTGDFPVKPVKDGTHYYFCCEKKEDLEAVVPDFIFSAWPQVGIPDYDKTAEEIAEAGSKDYQHPRMLWIGNTQTHQSRERFLEIAQEHPGLIDAYDTNASLHILSGEKVPYISLIDHTKYKYLIDIEGRGYSGRLKLLLFSGRVLFIQERRWKEFFHFDLQPYVHFIPVKNDFSDLMEQINYVEAQGDEYYRKIVRQASEFAQHNLKRQNAVERYHNMIHPG